MGHASVEGHTSKSLWAALRELDGLKTKDMNEVGWVGIRDEPGRSV